MDNAEKNSYVKNQITNALLKLLETKELCDISISEITNKAQVSRISFYRNYETKEAVLREYIQKLFCEWNREYDENGKPHSDQAHVGAMFAHFIKYKPFYLLLHERGISYLMRDAVGEVMTKGLNIPDRESNIGAYILSFFVYGFYGWVEEWFACGMQESAEEMVELLVLTSGVRQ